MPGGQRLININAPAGSDLVEVEAVQPGVLPAVDHYRLTPLGLEFLDAWTGAQPIDGLDSPEA